MYSKTHLLALIAGSSAILLMAQPRRIASGIDEGQRVTIQGSHLRTRQAIDLGAVDPARQMPTMALLTPLAGQLADFLSHHRLYQHPSGFPQQVADTLL